jgi:hypothetical protein
MHSNVMLRFMVQALQDLPLCSSTSAAVFDESAWGRGQFLRSGCESTFFFNRSSTGMSHPGVYVIRQVRNVLRNLKREF